MQTFTATFSNGHTAKRNSEHTYRWAIGYFDRVTGKSRAVIFTSSEVPRVSWQAIGLGDCYRGFGSTTQKAKWQKQVEAKREMYFYEIVAVTVKA